MLDIRRNAKTEPAMPNAFTDHITNLVQYSSYHSPRCFKDATIFSSRCRELMGWADPRYSTF